MGKKKKRIPPELKLEFRLKSAQLFLEGKMERAVLLALAPVLLPEEVLRSLLKEGEVDWEGLAFHLLAHLPPEPLKGTWPGGYGWPFLDPAIRLAALVQKGGLVQELSRVALSAPFFLASTVAAAAAEWGPGEELERLCGAVLRVLPLLRKEGMERYLGAGPKTLPAPTNMPR